MGKKARQGTHLWHCTEHLHKYGGCQGTGVTVGLNDTTGIIIPTVLAQCRCSCLRPTGITYTGQVLMKGRRILYVLLP